MAATPIEQITGLRLGSRPAVARPGRVGGGGASPTLASLRAIPWVFAWTQIRANVPAWYGLGTAVDACERRHGAAGLARLQRLYGTWPFLRLLVQNAEVALARTDPADHRPPPGAGGGGRGAAGSDDRGGARAVGAGRPGDHRPGGAARRAPGPPALDRASGALPGSPRRAPGGGARAASRPRPRTHPRGPTWNGWWASRSAASRPASRERGRGPSRRPVPARDSSPVPRAADERSPDALRFGPADVHPRSPPAQLRRPRPLFPPTTRRSSSSTSTGWRGAGRTPWRAPR